MRSSDISYISKFDVVGQNAYRRIRGFALPSLLVVMVAWVTPAYSLGVGAASADSYIGQPLSAVIPVFNVANPDDIGIAVVSSSLSENNGPSLSARIERANSQLAIRVVTEEPLSEPYVTFSLTVDDQGNMVQKEFTLLLNLAPRGVATRPLIIQLL